MIEKKLNEIIFKNDEVNKIIDDLAAKIIKFKFNFSNLIIVGIKEGGVALSDLIHKKVKEGTGFDCLSGYVDITLYRDDSFAVKKTVKSTEMPFNINDKDILLVDDVIYSGRTVRAAIDDLICFGRPKSVKLAVLIDRGGREIPICPDFTGKKIKIPNKYDVKVELASKNKFIEKI